MRRVDRNPCVKVKLRVRMELREGNLGHRSVIEQFVRGDVLHWRYRAHVVGVLNVRRKIHKEVVEVGLFKNW